MARLTPQEYDEREDRWIRGGTIAVLFVIPAVVLLTALYAFLTADGPRGVLDIGPSPETAPGALESLPRPWSNR